jgi:hypothetical protein
MRRSLRINRRGELGPFEDLTALVVVSVALTILVGAIVASTVARNADASTAGLWRDCERVTDVLRSSEGLARPGTSGVLDSTKVMLLDANFSRLVSPESVGLPYTFSILDVSGYDASRSFTRTNVLATSAPAGKTTIEFRSAVSISVSPEESHAALLIVSCWR